MEDTHTVPQLESLLFEFAQKIRDVETKEEKKVLLKKLKGYEKQWNNVMSKHINGKKYPEPMKGFPDDIPMNIKEVNKLIDSVEVDEEHAQFTNQYDTQALMLEGVYTKGSLQE